MIYVFVCVSDKCIGTQQAIKVYKCVVPDSENFADDQKYDDVCKLDDKQLIKMGLIDDPKKQDEKEDSWEDDSDEGE